MTREWEHGSWTTGMRILDQDHRGYTGTRNGGYQGLECYNDSMILDVETLGKRNIEDWSAGTLGIGLECWDIRNRIGVLGIGNKIGVLGY